MNGQAPLAKPEPDNVSQGEPIKVPDDTEAAVSYLPFGNVAFLNSVRSFVEVYWSTYCKTGSCFSLSLVMDR